MAGRAKLDPAALARARMAAGLTTTALAERLKVDITLVSQWEGRHRGISAANLRRLAAELGVRPAQLLYPVDNPTLADLRDLAALTQAEVALRLGIPRKRIVEWESGRHGVTGAMRINTLQVLGITLQHLKDTPPGHLPQPIIDRLAEVLGVTAEEVAAAVATSSRAGLP